MRFSNICVPSILVPAPEVVISHSQTNFTLLAGSQLTIFCDITVDPNIDTPFAVDTVWTSVNSDDMTETIDFSSSRVSVYDPESTGFNQYQSRIEFSTLSSTNDPGLYRCEVVIDSNSNYIFVLDSEEYNATTTFKVIGKFLKALMFF